MRTFTPATTLTDVEFKIFDSAFDISGFLLGQGSVLGTATWPDVGSPVELSTSALIKKCITNVFPHSSSKDDVSEPPYCSSQLILASLQREQSLIGLGRVQALALKAIPRMVEVQLYRGKPTELKTLFSNSLYYKFDWALGYGALDRPGPGLPFPPKWDWFRSFQVQIRAASRRYAELFAEFGQRGPWKNAGGKIVLLDEELDGKPNDWKKNPVYFKPENAATWALLRYTPRLDSLKLTFQLFARYGFLRG